MPNFIYEKSIKITLILFCFVFFALSQMKIDFISACLLEKSDYLSANCFSCVPVCATMTHLSSDPVELQYPIKYPQGDKHLEKFLISFPGGLFRKLISDIAGELKLIFKFTPPVEKVTCERSSFYYVTSNFVFAIKKFFSENYQYIENFVNGKKC